MTADQRFALTMALLAAALAALGWLVRSMAMAIVKWTQTQDQLSGVAKDIGDLAVSIRADITERQGRADAEHGEIKDRLTRLEQAELDRYRAMVRQP